MDESIITRLRESCRRNPERLAVSFRPGFRFQNWSYGQLWEDVCKLSGEMKRRGLQPGDRVLVWAPNCPQWVITFFGVLKAGGVIVPMDMRVSEQFVADVCEKTRPKFSFVSRATPDIEPLASTDRIYFEDLATVIDAAVPDADDADISVELAEIMFTSGTTGTPKGVMLSHRNLIASIDAADHHMHAVPDFRMVSVLPLSHVFEQAGGMLMPLLCGASITYATSRQPRRLFRLMADTRVTTMLLVPQALDLFMRGIEREVDRKGKRRGWNLLMRVSSHLPFGMRRYLFRSLHKKLGGSLGYIVCGGAQINPEVAKKWELVGVRVVQGYGVTEAAPTIASSTYAERRFDSLGRPLPGVDVRITEDGEIQVRGPNISSGYWENQEATAAAFDDGWFKTGDMGFLDDSGYLHMQGRKRHMIVLPNGMNVFPEDVEARIIETGLVSEVAVVGLEDGSGTQVHAVASNGDADSLEEAVQNANRQLGDHQRIAGFSVWPEEELPKTHTLKVKKHEIIEWLQSSGGKREAAELESSNSHSELSSVVAGIARVSLDTVTDEKTLGSDLGIDSLGRVELLAAIEERMGVILDEGAISDETTVGDLRNLVESVPDAGSDAEIAFPTWGRKWWARGLRGLLQTFVVASLARLAYRRSVRGTENLGGSQGVVIYAANHSLHLDNALILRSFPYGIRKRLAVAAAAENWSSRWLSILYPILGNAFPIARHGPVMPSLENLGNVLDDKWSVLIYPEGDLYVGKGMQPFKTGVGLIAVESGVPVVPLRLDIHEYGWPSVVPVVKRGKVSITFGKPMTFNNDHDYQSAAREIEDAVKAL